MCEQLGLTKAYREAESIAFRLSGIGTPINAYGGAFSMNFPMKIVEERGLRGVFGGRSFTETYLTLNAGLLHKPTAFEDASVSVEYVYRRISDNGYFFQISPLGVGGHRVLLPFGDSLAAPSSGIQQHPLTNRKWYVTPLSISGFWARFCGQTADLARHSSDFNGKNRYYLPPSYPTKKLVI